MNKNHLLLVALAAGVLSMAAIAGYSVATRNAATDASTVAPTVASQPAIETGSADAVSTEKQLVYLIEEEKLAHDVYTKLYEMYGARVFGNILNSEQTHQSRVLTLLQARNIADPRSEQVGVFNDPELQGLYNQLIDKGSKSERDAYEVGVAIEEKDIADINTQLETASETDVIQTLEDLRRGSENHLRAFNKQL
jgi:hypothetical protein